jgi:hypothetical protein
MPEVTVTLRNKKISVDQAKVQASEKAGHKVRWISMDGPFKITFKPGSDWPHPPAARQDGGAWVIECGPFNRPGRTLSYAVSADGFDTLDPDIEIIP